MFTNTHIYINVSIGGPGADRTERVQVVHLAPCPPFEFDDSYTLWPILTPDPPLDGVNLAKHCQLGQIWPNLVNATPG